METAKKIFLVLLGVAVLIIAVEYINAAKYDATVNVVEGSNVMGVNPLTDKLDFGDLARNNGMTRYIDVANAGNVATYILVWETGEIADLITASKNNFTLNPGQNIKLAFELHVPDSAAAKRYGGMVMIFRLPKLF
ncbi:MAG: hypothetical protein MUD10_02140 [Candidatus Pacebacteria bacterium]|jgi:hypothetical protein|nr:hypothetical protein [Candidatus Paceibacterota bacterium]